MLKVNIIIPYQSGLIKTTPIIAKSLKHCYKKVYTVWLNVISKIHNNTDWGRGW